MGTKKALAYCIVLATAVPGCAIAQTAAGAARVTVDSLSDINNQNVLKTAQLQGLELDEKIKKLKPAAGDDASVRTKESSSDVPVSEDDSLPVVQGVYGANGQLFATLAYADGRRAIDVKKGAHVPGGYTVAELAPDAVTLSRGKQRLVVGFADRAIAPVVRPSAPAYPTGPGLPLGMPMGAGVPPIQ